MCIIWFASFACASISNTTKVRGQTWDQTLIKSKTVDSCPKPTKKTTVALINSNCLYYGHACILQQIKRVNYTEDICSKTFTNDLQPVHEKNMKTTH